MPVTPSYGLAQARVITRHGEPYAAVVPLKDLEKSRSTLRTSSSLLALRGTGQGLWGPNAGQTIAKLRGEWGDD